MKRKGKSGNQEIGKSGSQEVGKSGSQKVRKSERKISMNAHEGTFKLLGGWAGYKFGTAFVCVCVYTALRP